jgi:pSer/pThr/pTyr-binding forkhead associated (FHA) protein
MYDKFLDNDWHLDIQFDGRFATVYDLGSTNGTNVNGHDVGSQLLRHGDVIRVGHTRLVYQQEQV